MRNEEKKSKLKGREKKNRTWRGRKKNQNKLKRK